MEEANIKTEIEVIEPSFIIETELDGGKILESLEKFGRVSHKSEDKISLGTAKEFIKKLLEWGHESILEHISITVRIICDRGVTHELVRHRNAAYTQESTRYCNYSGKIQFINPLFFKPGSSEYSIWLKGCEHAAEQYTKLINMGSKPEEARSVLPNSLKTEIIVTCNLREWRHIFKMRCSSAAHPQIRQIMVPLLQEFQKRIPVIFDDFDVREIESTYPLVATKKQ